jgi:rubrerythrin
MTRSRSERLAIGKMNEDWGIPESPEFSAAERLIAEFQWHEVQEESSLQRYRELAKTSPNALIRFLLRLILTDEERHQAVIRLIVSSLRKELSPRSQIATAQPDETVQGLYELESEGEDLLKITEDFLRMEREGIREHKKLLRASRRHHQGLFSLLCKAMIYDSKKHVEILEFLRAKLKKG